jgi:hypothetical protein
MKMFIFFFAMDWNSSNKTDPDSGRQQYRISCIIALSLVLSISAGCLKRKYVHMRAHYRAEAPRLAYVKIATRCVTKRFADFIGV